MENLYKQAENALRFAYAPFSRYKVGAALMAKDGRVFTGCNVENEAYGSTMCAERVAFFKAISEGVTDFKAMAIANSRDTNCMPCGACRQVMAEFCEDDFMIILKDTTFSFGEIFPESFELYD